ncbi:MAG: hypothetical protein KatS3mg103_1166 [Phycisphaerales bacterium]|nr:MAG: hypothetical protein KatS3mg103_1166 [Phycisphaerales bacterium]
MTQTIFDRILAGEVPCHRVYEDDHVLAFLDIAPLSRGHTLVIPKERAARMDQLSDASAAALGRVLPRLCRAVVQATGAPAYNLLQNNGHEAHQAVMHLHVHHHPPAIRTGPRARPAAAWASSGPPARSRTDPNWPKRSARRSTLPPPASAEQ